MIDSTVFFFLGHLHPREEKVASPHHLSRCHHCIHSAFQRFPGCIYYKVWSSGPSSGLAVSLCFSASAGRLQTSWKPTHTRLVTQQQGHDIKHEQFCFEDNKLVSPALVSCVSPEPAAPSRSWWGKGCLGVYTASVSGVGPCPAAPVSCGELWPHPDETWRSQESAKRFTKPTHNPLSLGYRVLGNSSCHHIFNIYTILCN